MQVSLELYTIYGISFTMLGVVIFAQPRTIEGNALSKNFWLLGLFGASHGTLELAIAWDLDRGAQIFTPPLLGSLLLLASFVPLLEFSRRSVSIAFNQPLIVNLFGKPTIYVYLTAASLLYYWTGAGGEHWISTASQYFVEFPAAFLAGISLWRGSTTQLRSVRFLASALLAYSVFGGLVVDEIGKLPSFFPSQEAFQQLIGVPVQLFRAGCAILASLSILFLARGSAIKSDRRADERAEQINKLVGSLESQVASRTESLIESEGRLKEAERIAKFGHWIRFPDGQVKVSEQAMLMFGLTGNVNKITLAQLRKQMHKDDRKTTIALAENAFVMGTSYTSTFRMKQQDDSYSSFRQTAAPVFDEQQNLRYLQGVVQDITEIKLVEEKLQQAVKLEAIGNLTGGIAHDFNNLLAVILGNLELLREEATSDSEIELIDAGIDATHRGADLTRNMLSFARRARLSPSELDLNELVLSVKKWAGRTLPANINVETSLLAGLWPIEVDISSTESALLNLLLNARDAMPKGGKLTIETANIRVDQDYIEHRQEDLEPGRYVMLAVSDNGTGISEKTLGKIFDPFFTTKPPGSGTGLGLSMVLGFMKQSSGTARVYSEVGVGTTLKLFFKASMKHMESKASHPAPLPLVAIGSQNLLVVEDNVEVLKVLTAALLKVGYNVQTATTGDMAYEIFEKNPTFDVLLTDIVMPGKLQGTDLAKKLRHRWPELPVIFMSGYANEATVHGNGLGSEDIRLMKPVRRADLIKAIQSLT